MVCSSKKEKQLNKYEVKGQVSLEYLQQCGGGMRCPLESSVDQLRLV